MAQPAERFLPCWMRDLSEEHARAKNLTGRVDSTYTPVNDYETEFDFAFNGTCGFAIHYVQFDPAKYSAQVHMVSRAKNSTAITLQATIMTCDNRMGSHIMTENDLYEVVPTTQAFVYIERSPAREIANETNCPGVDRVTYTLVGLEDSCKHPEQIPQLPQCKNAKIATTSPPPAASSTAPSTVKRSQLVSVITACLMVVGGLSSIC